MPRKKHTPEQIIAKLRQIEAENSRLKRAIADLTLDNQILKGAAEGNF